MEIDGVFIILDDKKGKEEYNETVHVESTDDVVSNSQKVIHPDLEGDHTSESASNEIVEDNSSLFKLLSLISNNLVISITNMHVRYQHSLF